MVPNKWNYHKFYTTDFTLKINQKLPQLSEFIHSLLVNILLIKISDIVNENNFHKRKKSMRTNNFKNDKKES